jgi:hypothetical protein
MSCENAPHNSLFKERGDTHKISLSKWRVQGEVLIKKYSSTLK